MPAENLLKDLDYSVLQQCIHCGMCLPQCPTYDETLKETSSPRGRIALMRAVADGELSVTPGFSKEMYFCMGCLACQSVCPAVVKYAELIERARAEVQRVAPGGVKSTLRLWLLNGLFGSRSRLRAVARVLRFFQKTGLQTLAEKLGLFRIFGRKFFELEKMAPEISDSFTPYGVFPAKGKMRHRVGLIAGCVQDVSFANVNRDTIEVLQQNGCEVVVPATQQCCGSLHGHNGERAMATELAKANLEAFGPENLDAIIVNSAGCGSFMKHYEQLFENDPIWHEKARKGAALVKDVSEFLVSIGFRKPASSAPEKIRATYHDACHLCHGQKIRSQPREILRAIPGLELVDLPESEWCCGSAGIYNITHPELAMKLLERKMKNIRETGATTVASGNPGCTIQLRFGAERNGERLSVIHPVTFLATAYRVEAGTKRVERSDKR